MQAYMKRPRCQRPSETPRKLSARVLTGRASLLVAAGVLGAFATHMNAKTGQVARPQAVAEVDEAVVQRFPVEVNERVDRWMRRFLTDQRPTFEVFLARRGLFGPIIRRKLAERGMPEELLYLAMIESGFSVGATSPVGAGGMWQFMRPTAVEYGLRVDRWVDERRDPLRATDAALDYLAWLHLRYGSWPLAAAAYNAGPARVDRALQRHGVHAAGDADLYWEIIEHLPPETRDYVPKILAATALARRSRGFGLGSVDPLQPYIFDRVWVPGGTPLSVLAERLDTERTVLSGLNPHLVRGITPPGASYGLRVPVGSIPDVVAVLGNWWRVAADD